MLASQAAMQQGRIAQPRCGGSLPQQLRVGGVQQQQRRRSTAARAAAAAVATQAAGAVAVADVGSVSLQGTVRKVNEDRFDLKLGDLRQAGITSFAGVYDGHGGSAAAEWLTANLAAVVAKCWDPANPAASIDAAYRAADKSLLVSSGFMGMGERGIGGSKCGATAVTVALFPGPNDTTQLLAANVGDARILLVGSDGATACLTEEHVPDKESERVRIEGQNPNPKMPMVRYIGGTWRVGGLLALSRAFGDAYLKGSLQFEGVAVDASNRYSSGFGVVSTPHVELRALVPGKDAWLVLASDGLFAEEARGGGGGLDEEGVGALCAAAGAAGASAQSLAASLAEAAVKVGSTDDVTVVVLKLA